jgi:hypothetical protein
VRTENPKNALVGVILLVVDTSVLVVDKLTDEPAVAGAENLNTVPELSQRFIPSHATPNFELGQAPIDLPDSGVIAGVQEVEIKKLRGGREVHKPIVVPLPRFCHAAGHD